MRPKTWSNRDCCPSGVRLTPVAAFLAVLICAGAPAMAAQEAGAEQCLDPQACPIPYVRLAKQETEPFMFNGKIVDEDHPRFDQYERALRQFPDVRSCLKRAECDKTQLDLRMINWAIISSIEKIDVCVFRVASSISEQAIIAQWLVSQHFRVGSATKIRHEFYVPKFEAEPMVGIQAHLPVEKFRAIIPQSLLGRVIGFDLVRNYWLTIVFSLNGEVVGVSSGANTKLN